MKTIVGGQNPLAWWRFTSLWARFYEIYTAGAAEQVANPFFSDRSVIPALRFF